MVVEEDQAVVAAEAGMSEDEVASMEATAEFGAGVKPVEPEDKPKPKDEADDSTTAEKPVEEAPGTDADVTKEAEPDKDAPPKGEEPEAPVMDARLKHTAERLKLSDEDIKAMGDAAPEILAKLADSQDSVSSAYAEIGRKAKEAGDGELNTNDIGKPFDLNLNRVDDDGDAVFGDDALEVFQGQSDQIEALRGAQQSFMERVLPIVEDIEEKQSSDEWRTLDGFFEEHAGDFGEIFGKGSTADLDDESGELKARRGLWEQAKLIVSGYEAHGKHYELKDILRQALHTTQAEHLQELARKKVMAGLKERGKQVSPRPRKRSTSTQSPRERAVASVAATVRDLSWDV